MSEYVETDYSDGYVDGDSLSTTYADNYADDYYADDYYEEDIVFDPLLATKKKINFIIDNQNLSDENINELLLAKYGADYTNNVNVILGSSLKVAEQVDDIFSVKEVVGGISQEQLDVISAQIPTITSIKEMILQDDDFMGAIKTSVASAMKINIVAQNGTTIASDLIFDETENKYVLNYDTTQLDGTDYTIELNLD